MSRVSGQLLLNLQFLQILLRSHGCGSFDEGSDHRCRDGESFASVSLLQRPGPRRETAVPDATASSRQETAVLGETGMPRLTRASDVLTADLVNLGLRLFGSQQALDSVVAKSSVVPIVYANTSMEIRVADGDDALQRLTEDRGDGYGLDTLLELRAKPAGMLNVADMGANYGVVTIAAFKKYPQVVRAVVVEPVPATYFFLHWNMHLNGIPVFDEAGFLTHGHQPGAVLLHKGVSSSKEVLRICSPPWSTMKSYPPLDDKHCKCLDPNTPCHKVPSISSDRMLNLFGSEEIALLKMDCEGCDKASLPYITNGPLGRRVKRLAGELNDPDPSLVQLACKWDHAKFLTAWCRGGVGRVKGSDMCSRCKVW